MSCRLIGTTPTGAVIKDERDSVVEIMQAVSMLPGIGYCSPITKNTRVLLDRAHVIQTIYQASRR